MVCRGRASRAWLVGVGVLLGCGDAAPADDSSHDGGGNGPPPLEALHDASTDAGNPVVGSQIVGQYWLRTEVQANATQSVLPGVDAQIDSDIVAYSLVDITEQEGSFVMVDWQCQVRTVQECRSLCTASETSTSEGQAYRPSRRIMSIQGSSWSAGACAQAFGFNYDCATDGAPTLPADLGDARINDAGGGGPGVDIFIKLNDDPNRQCTFQAVQLVDLVYSGTLAAPDQLHALGTVQNQNSSQRAIDTTACGVPESSIPSPVVTAPGSLRFVPAPQPFDAAASRWTCPSLSDFRAAFGD